VLIPHFEEDGGVSNGSDRINLQNKEALIANLMVTKVSLVIKTNILKIIISYL
jgi:hypothetical protein